MYNPIENVVERELYKIFLRSLEKLRTFWRDFASPMFWDCCPKN